jgi:hypothetical protein
MHRKTTVPPMAGSTKVVSLPLHRDRHVLSPQRPNHPLSALHFNRQYHPLLAVDQLPVLAYSLNLHAYQTQCSSALA